MHWLHVTIVATAFIARSQAAMLDPSSINWTTLFDIAMQPRPKMHERFFNLTPPDTGENDTEWHMNERAEKNTTRDGSSGQDVFGGNDTILAVLITLLVVLIVFIVILSIVICLHRAKHRQVLREHNFDKIVRKRKHRKAKRQI